VGLASDDRNRDDVPDVGGNDERGDEVQLIFGVGHTVGGDVAFIGIASFVAGAFDLDAEDASVVFEHEVVGSGVSPRFGEHEAVFGGAGHEAEFGPFSAEFAVLDLSAGDGTGAGFSDHEFGPNKKGAALVGPRLNFSILN